MVFDIIFDIVTLLLLLYVIVAIRLDTTKIEYSCVCGINKIYNWFKNFFVKKK